jgi:hypothetical protein
MERFFAADDGAVAWAMEEHGTGETLMLKDINLGADNHE